MTIEYILFIHKNTQSMASDSDWKQFIDQAIASGFFRGGSEIANSTQVGDKPLAKITDTIGGFMRFETQDKTALLDVLSQHPVVRHGGTVELCEMPKSDQ